MVGDYVYRAGYGSRPRVQETGDRGNPVGIPCFDRASCSDDGSGPSARQSGAWNNDPVFGHGLVICTSVREGLFIMRVRPPIS